MVDDTEPVRNRRGRRRRTLVLGALVAAILALAVACDPAPGTGRIRLSGAVNGTADTGTAGCYGPGHIPGSDDYGSWEWSGTVDGRPVVVTIANFVVWYGAWLDVDGVAYWGGGPFEDPPASSFTITEGVGRFRGTMRNPDDPSGPAVEVALTFTCPAA